MVRAAVVVIKEMGKAALMEIETERKTVENLNDLSPSQGTR